MDASSIGMLVAVLSPLVGVPLAAITLYLRSIHEHQTAGAAELINRIQSVEQSIRELSRCMTDIERDYTTKEEWLRESMHARRQLERLTEMMVRVQAQIEGDGALAAEIARACKAMTEAAQTLNRSAGPAVNETTNGD